MGILRNSNFRRHTRTLRSLDYENMPSSVMRESGNHESGRLSDELYEGTSRVPRGPAAEVEVPEDAPHLAVRGERPHPRAQWDDVQGVWVVWDDEAGDWMPVESDR
jgi:hypothetical protein